MVNTSWSWKNPSMHFNLVNIPFAIDPQADNVQMLRRPDQASERRIFYGGKPARGAFLRQGGVGLRSGIWGSLRNCPAKMNLKLETTTD